MVQLQAVSGMSDVTDADAIILSLFQDETLSPLLQVLDEALNGAVQTLLDDGDFIGKLNETAVLYTNGQIATRRVLLVGLGNRDEFDIDSVRNVAATAAKKASALKLKHVATMLHGDGALDDEAVASAIAEATILALYYYHGQKTNTPPQQTLVRLDVVLADEADVGVIEQRINEGVIIAESTAVARDLVNMPPNYCTPEYMAARAIEIGGETSLVVEVLDEAKIRELQMGALLAVSDGSDTPPKFIIFEHNAEQAADFPTVILVGKGVTFDTGGYTIKTRDGMVGMKGDMGGGAAVIGAMRAISLLNVPLHVVGLVPAADNMISGHSYRPDDVFTASNGKTIEIVSTDAEGRMLLADALVYAQRYQPDAVVDIATLTGAVYVALGGVMAGVFTTNSDLRDALVSAGESVNELLWPMPIHKGYGKSLKTDTADTKNSGARMGGASIAAMFLQNFVDFPAWAHLDIAGMERGNDESAYQAKKGASGFGTRLLIEFVRNWGQA